MGIKPQLPALALAIGLVTIALALLNADKIGEGLILGVVAMIAVRHWAGRRADAYLAKLYAEHGDRMDEKPPAPGDRHTPTTGDGRRETGDGMHAQRMGSPPRPRDRQQRHEAMATALQPSSRRRCGSTPPPRLRTTATTGSPPTSFASRCALTNPQRTEPPKKVV